MARTQTMVQLSDELVAELDAAASRRGVSRSALIRELVGAGLRQEREQAVGERIADGYRRIPQLAPDEWGQPSALVDAATGDLLARLDAEDRAAGDGPW